MTEPATHLVNAPDTWQRVQWMLRAADWVAFDVETTSHKGGFEDWHDTSRIVTVSFATKADEAWVLPLGHPAAEHGATPAEVFEALAGCQLVGHNIKFDARWAHSYSGIDLSSFLAWDTMAAAYLQDENRPVSLKSVAQREIGVADWDDNDAKINPLNVPLDQLVRYNGLDAAYTFALHEKQRAELRTDKLGRLLWFILMPAIRALTSIEQEGMQVDVEYVRDLAAKNAAEISTIEADLLRAVPVDLLRKYAKDVGQQSMFDEGGEAIPDVSWAPTSKFFLEFAERAGWPVLARSEKTQKPAWGSAILKQVARRGFPDAQALMRQRKLRKQQDAFLLPWQTDVDRNNRLHPTFSPVRFEDDSGEGGTLTGRLSCKRPNLQQVARVLKPAFDAPPGWLVLQADKSQIEVRIVAHTSGDSNLTRVYIEGRDVYKETAAGIRGVDSSEITSEDRQRTKPVVLGFLYGMGSRSFVDYARDTYDIEYTQHESAEVRQAFFDLYPGLTTWHERVRRLVRRQGYVESELGRRRRVPEARSSDRTAQGRAERQAINAQIQSFASDLMLMALARVREEIPSDVFRSVGTVHDSLLGYVREDVAEEVAREVGRLMVTPRLDLFGVELSVPLAADIEWGPRWGKAEHEITVSSTEFTKEIAA